eukprot:TRINITY_DN23359_c0_g1_i1.p2 TRINITY_DN23359_c0_g1~~TRINITY_DN23359_c0_g1_i1.p2  ORF type:complete len:1255 (+),score=571.61 TRINITY_DN23359_c0_g1_i1:138-3902(+)
MDAASNAMLVKFETRSNRVKGLSFHGKRPWVLASLHNGAIQLWDYRMGTLIDRFEEHDGPVRGIDFHSSQPLFCSGGDDYKVKVWNYKLRRCLFTLVGHLDYIRTVQFHQEQPWIVSASDDQTLRIWNWQGRSCISVLTGHNHYVMSAAFHPRDDLVVSASLDQTLRVWDITGLKAKRSSGDTSFAANVTQDIFGSSDVMVKFILEGHEKGVNYATFHPDLPLIISGSDDRSIRIWRMDESRAYEIEQFRGHVSNVSCVTYFKDHIVSNSEDRSIRVWDVKMRSAIHVLRRDTDRFWVLAVHAEKNLIAAGHDTGMIVFKLERERPAMQTVGNTLYWVRDRKLCTYDFETKSESTPLVLSRRQTYPPHTLSYCKEEKMAVFYYAQDGGTFELYSLGKSSDQDVKRGFYTSAVFFSRNKFAVLDKARQIIIKNTKNDIVTVIPPIAGVDEIFWAPGGCVLLRGDDRISLYDVAQKKCVADCTAAKVKYVTWSPDSHKLALLSKHVITVLHKQKLKSCCSIHENSRIKSACFDEKGSVLLYSTLNHLKYCLLNGDTGTIKTLDSPIYLVRFDLSKDGRGDEVSFLTREGKVQRAAIDTTELRFKMALLGERWGDVLRIVKQHKIHGQALVSYLQQRGFPEVAMHFVKDQRIRFRLAVECGNLEVAQECAERLDDQQCWTRLADVAMTHGNVEVMNLALNRAKTPAGLQRLSFLHFLLGDDEKCRDYADMQRDDINVRFQAALFTGDAEARVRLLEDAGQFTLAHEVAVRHGMDEKAAKLRQKATQSLMQSLVKPPPEEEDMETEEQAAERQRQEDIAKQRAFELQERLAQTTPGQPLQLPGKRAIATNWPLLQVQESYVFKFLRGDQAEQVDDDEGGDAGAAGDWDLDMGDDDDAPKEKKGAAWGMDDMDIGGGESGDAGGGDWDLDIDIDVNAGEVLDAMRRGKDFVMPTEGKSVASQWVENSKLATDHIAAGSFESAMRLLRTQVGISDFAPLKQQFINIFAAANASAPVLPTLPAHSVYLNRCTVPDKLPLLAMALPSLQEQMRGGHAHTTGGKFGEATRVFQTVLHQALFLVVEEQDKVREVRDLIKQARVYCSAMQLETARKDLKDDPVRSCEMAAYFTHYEMQPKHVELALGLAMSQAWKIKNVKTAAVFARRLCEGTPPAKMLQQAKKVIQTGETTGDAQKIDYDARNPFELCVVTWKPMYRGVSEPIKCTYCLAPANSSVRGRTCPVCLVGTLGGQATGLLNTIEHGY